jgi:hypothetical protein
MRPVHRWGFAAVATALVLLTPYAGRARPTHDPDVDTSAVVAAVRGSADASYSGLVEVRGRLALPIADHFTDLADLFGGQTRLRVWWRGEDDWRVDRLLDTGEVDLFHQGPQTVEWNYERGEAEASIDPAIRLPRDSDLLPPEVARRALDGTDPADVSRLPMRRVAGVDAVGLRVTVADSRSTIRHVDLWVDPATGITLAVDVYGEGAEPTVSSAFTTFSADRPGIDVTSFRPSRGVPVRQDHIIDIADAADQFGFVRPPATLAGLGKDAGRAAAVYGSGLTRLLALPLPGHEADQLAYRLFRSGAQRSQGRPLLRVGPLGVVISHTVGSRGIRWLLAGTLTDEALLEAAADLDHPGPPR